MQKIRIKATGPSAPKSVPSVGAPSAVAPRPPKPNVTRVKPAAASTREYGKPAPPSTNPFGVMGGGTAGGI